MFSTILMYVVLVYLAIFVLTDFIMLCQLKIAQFGAFSYQHLLQLAGFLAVILVLKHLGM